MILQALCEFYGRSNLASIGWEYREIPFVIVLDRNGHLVQLESTITDTLKRGSRILVPRAEIRSGKNAWAQPNLLWDHYGFVLGQQKLKPNGQLDPTDDPAKVKRQHDAFVHRIETLAKEFAASPGLSAACQFYRSNEPKKVLSSDAGKDMLRIPGANLTFRLVDSVEPIFHEVAIRSAVPKLTDGGAPSSDGAEIEANTTRRSSTGVCLVSGRQEVIARLHPKIRGVGEKPSALASANTLELNALGSFGKEQGLNFPVGLTAAAQYSTALNHLLARDSSHRLQIGDTSTVIWAQRPDELEDALPQLFGESKDDPAAGLEAATKLLNAVQSGRLAGADGDNRFYVLGLAPNAARIAVRFWQAEPLARLAPRVLQHFEDLCVARPPNAPEYLSLFRLLLHCATLRKADNIPPLLSGDIVRAVFTGENTPYPHVLLNAAVNRCRAEQEVPYPRAAAIKGCLNRHIRSTRSTEKEFTPMLDTNNPNVAYRLGRLFAALEKIQEEAQPSINATIRERYYGAASSTPVSVFTTLLRLKNHHLAKLPTGRKIWFEKQLGEVLGGIADFPAHLNLPAQGRFALGYYHQRQAFFTKSTDKE